MTCKCGKEIDMDKNHLMDDEVGYSLYCYKCGRSVRIYTTTGFDPEWYEPSRPTVVTDEEIEQAAFSQSVKFSGMDYFRDGAKWMREKMK